MGNFSAARSGATACVCVGLRRHSLIVGMVAHSLQELVWGLGGKRSFRAGIFQPPPGNHSALQGMLLQILKNAHKVVTSTLVSALMLISPSNLRQQNIQPSPLFPAGKLVEELPTPKMYVHAAPSTRGPQSSLEDSEGLELEAG